MQTQPSHSNVSKHTHDADISNYTQNGMQTIRARRMMSRKSVSAMGILTVLEPGEDVPGCCICCKAPACCPIFSILPCCDDAEYVVVKREASKYIFIRENSIEWNDPEIVLKNGNCFGLDPCVYDVQDHVKVLFFDDPVFERITDQTRMCNETRTCLCGGRGDRIQLDSPCFCGICYRASSPCLFVPICLPSSCIPCALRYEIYTTDAQKGLYEIKKVRSHALATTLYGENSN